MRHHHHTLVVFKNNLLMNFAVNNLGKNRIRHSFIVPQAKDYTKSMNMKPNIAAIRAITAEFARQFVQPFFWVALGLLVCLVIITVLLAVNISPWWWLLAIPVVILGLAGIVIWLIVRLILQGLSPRLNLDQKTATKQLVTKLQFTKDTIQTPYPLIIFYVIRDIIFRRDKGFLSEVTEHSRTLKPDFEALKKLF